MSGKVKINKKKVRISWSDEDEREYLIPAAAQILVKDLEPVVAGQSLTGGPKNPQHILRIQGRDSVQKYLIEEVQQVYRAQGVAIHDKHIEIIVRQMLRRVRVDHPGDSEYSQGELVDRLLFESTNASILAQAGEPATAQPVLLGVTKASLNTDSFLAAASFQETTRVLAKDALLGKVDLLRGLKENVILGRLIPARYEFAEQQMLRMQPLTEQEKIAVEAGSQELDEGEELVTEATVDVEQDTSTEEATDTAEISTD